ncbi:MAG: hypothetical protein FJ290_29315 [Planctomycetes bacterium]|nr:hypothetical protein [Planctomycetota bacterium]
MEASVPPQAAVRRRGFFQRHRAKILLTALVVYTLALGVAVCDDVFHWGIFPTALEREAQGHIRQFDNENEAARKAAADKLAAEVDDFVAIPELIRALGDSSLWVRQAAADCLRRLTKADLPFDPAAAPAERRAAIARWRQWWRENKDRF